MEFIDKIAPEQFIHGINENAKPRQDNTDAFNSIDDDTRVALLYEPPVTYTLTKIGIFGRTPKDHAVKPIVCIRTDNDNAPSKIVLKQEEIKVSIIGSSWFYADLGPVVLLAYHKYWLVARIISLNLIREVDGGQSMPVMVEQSEGSWAPLLQGTNGRRSGISPILKLYGRVLPIG